MFRNPAKFTRHKAWVIVSFNCIFAAIATAEPVVTPPTPIETPRPATPVSKMGPQKVPGPEGWIDVRYTVQADGSVSDIKVLDAMPQRMKTDDAVRTISQWKFKPATRDGAPIAWHGGESLITFDVPEWPDQTTPWFSTQFTKVQKLLDEKKYKQARTESDKLFTQFVWRQIEIAHASVQRALIEIRSEDYHAANRAIRRATRTDLVALQPTEMKAALQYRFLVSLALGDLLDAMETFDRRQALEPLPEGDWTLTKAQEVRAALAKGGAVALKGRIDARQLWSLRPTRRSFSLTNVEGKISGIDAYCDTRYEQIKFEADSGWSIPADWGSCRIAVDGSPKTTFTMLLAD